MKSPIYPKPILNILPIVILTTSLHATTNWDAWMAKQKIEIPNTVVQNRAINRSDRFQIVGPFVGMTERRDLWNHYLLSLGTRYHFGERHGWEIVKLTWSFPSESHLASEIRENTGYQLDSQNSTAQISSSYIYTPVYGKYAWNGRSIIYFDVYGIAGLGIRFSNEKQPFLELGLGTSHYVFSKRMAIVPEFRLRAYREQRTDRTTVIEGVIQLGISFLL